MNAITVKLQSFYKGSNVTGVKENLIIKKMWFHNAITSRKYLWKTDTSFQLTVVLPETIETTYEKELLVENLLNYSAALALLSVSPKNIWLHICLKLSMCESARLQIKHYS